MSKASKDYIKARTAAAKWIYDRQEFAQLWGWAVLTKRNTDSATLGLPDTVAFNIFTDLAQRGLLVPFMHKGHEVCKLDLGRVSVWNEVMNPPGFFAVWVWRPAGKALSKVMQVGIWFVALVATVVVTVVLTKVLGG